MNNTFYAWAKKKKISRKIRWSFHLSKMWDCEILVLSSEPAKVVDLLYPKVNYCFQMNLRVDNILVALSETSHRNQIYLYRNTCIALSFIKYDYIYSVQLHAEHTYQLYAVKMFAGLIISILVLYFSIYLHSPFKKYTRFIMYILYIYKSSCSSVVYQ